jgi:hypothetical protein
MKNQALAIGGDLAYIASIGCSDGSRLSRDTGRRLLMLLAALI